MKYLTNIDLNKNQLLNAVTHKLATPPSSPVEGQDYYDTVTHRKYTWDGTKWVANDAVDSAMTGDNIVAALNASTALIDNDNLSITANNAITNMHTHSNKAVLDATTASFTTALNTKLSGIEASANVTDAANVGSSINGTTAKVTPVDADTVAIINSEASNVLSKVTFANVKAFLKTYFDTLYNKYVHPNHSGDVTSVADGATTISAKAVTYAKMQDVTASRILGRVTATNGVVEELTDTQIRTFLGVEAGANNYAHPTGDGNLHVPATSTTNSGKILTAGATAGSASWGVNSPDWANISSKPTSTVANIDSAVSNSHAHSNKALLDTYTQTNVNLSDAVSKKHAQNTDTGTTSATFTIGTSGVKVKNSGGNELQIRNNADSSYADLRVNNLIVEGTNTTINSNTVTIGDSELELNSDVVTSATNSDGGLTIKRLKVDNTTRADAKLTFNNSTGRWQSTQGDVANVVTAQLTNKITAIIGDASATSFVITHNLNTRDAAISIRESASPYAIVYTDIEMTSVNTVTIKFAVAPTAGQYTVNMIG